MELVVDTIYNEPGIKIPKNKIVKKILHHYLKIDDINFFCNLISNKQGVEFIDELLELLNIKYEINDNYIKHLPKNKPFIVISNHPFGFLDGLIMLSIFCKHNNNFKVMANYFLSQFEPVNNLFIELNPFSQGNAKNVKGLKTAYKHLNNGHAMGIFPAGEVATFQANTGKIEDKLWDKQTIKFIAKTKLPIVPLYISGNNSLNFHLLGKIHPNLRTLSIPAEFFNKSNQTINCRIGKPLYPADLNFTTDYDNLGRFLRIYLYSLNSQVNVKKFFKPVKLTSKKAAQIIPEIPVDKLANDINNLKKQNKLLIQKAGFEVYLAQATLMPNIFAQIGRLREITFRSVGEGTNKKTDIDGYDLYYLHLFVWDTTQQQIVGAYRLGQGDNIILKYGKKGFYTTTLFKYSNQFTHILCNTVEMGRSFIVPQYQQKTLPLFLLWQGILKYLQANPQYKYLIGPVSISNNFSPFSKDMIVSFIKKYHYDSDMSKMVIPKKPFKLQHNQTDISVILNNYVPDILKLDELISGIEPGFERMPVLLKQYIKQTAKILAFNVDPKFNNSLDGLMILDINNLPKNTIDFLSHR